MQIWLHNSLTESCNLSDPNSEYLDGKKVE